jgi:outer membrane receptor protein involved in Fe transport
VEAEATLAVNWVTLEADLALSHNRILDLDAVALGYPTAVIGSQPPGVPELIANGILTLQPATWLRVDLLGRYNGGYYADIENTEAHHLDPFFVADGVLTVHVPDVIGAGFIEGKLQVNNILNRNYAAAVNGGGFFPGASRNLLGTVSIGF